MKIKRVKFLLLCDYGCGKLAKFFFKNGKGCCEDNFHKCPGAKAAMSEKMLGKKRPDQSRRWLVDNPMKTFEAREAISKRMSGENNPMFGRTGKDNPNFGKHHTKEFCQTRSERMSGENHPMYGRTGKNHPLYGRKRPEHSLRMSGKGNPSWQGGIAAEPYCDIWLDQDYKESILERDNHTCQNPDCWKTSGILCLHHIDYIKKNCDPWNLIALCNSCNGRANFNKEYWQELYQNIVMKKYYQGEQTWTLKLENTESQATQ